MNSSDANNGPARAIPLLPASSQLVPPTYIPAKWAPVDMIDENPSFSLLDYWDAID